MVLMPDAKFVRAADSSLLVIDIQERLISAMPARESVIRATNILLEAAVRLGIPVTVTEQYPKGLGPTVAEIASRIPAGAARLEKTCFSGAAAVVTGRPQVVIAGMETHVCVLQTALELVAAGREVYVAADAVCSRAEANYRNALARMRDAGVIVTNTESVLFEWLRDAAHDRFRAISKLIR